MNPLVQKALDIARSQIGVRESNDNSGPRVREYLLSAGVPDHSPWCASFVYWCVRQAALGLAVENPFVRTGYCPTIATWAGEHETLFDSPQAGDVFLLYGMVAGVFRAHHAGFVIEVSGSLFRTVEGNTNLDGSPQGIGVFVRERSLSERCRFVRWAKLAPGEEASASCELYLNGAPQFELPIVDGRALCPVRGLGSSWALPLPGTSETSPSSTTSRR